MARILLLLLLIAPHHSMAGNYEGDYSHSIAEERFSLRDFSQAAHFSIGIAGTTLGQRIFVRAGMSPFAATLTAAAITALAGTAKEVFFDDYTSRSGIKSFWAGAGAAALTLIVIDL